MKATAITLFALASFVPAASAQDTAATEAAEPEATVAAAATADVEARAVFEAGQAAFGRGAFADAFDYFQRAYALSARPQLLYNLGLAAANIGREREAVEHFERYLHEVPDAPNRDIVEARVAAMREEIAEEEAVAARLAAAEAERGSAPDNSGTMRDAGWGLVVAGAVLGVGGGVTYGIGVADVISVEGVSEGTPWPEVRDAASRAPILTGIGATVGIVGVTALAVGLGLALGTNSPSTTVGVLPIVDPVARTGGVVIRGGF